MKRGKIAILTILAICLIYIIIDLTIVICNWCILVSFPEIVASHEISLHCYNFMVQILTGFIVCVIAISLNIVFLIIQKKLKGVNKK